MALSSLLSRPGHEINLPFLRKTRAQVGDWKMILCNVGEVLLVVLWYTAKFEPVPVPSGRRHWQEANGIKDTSFNYMVETERMLSMVLWLYIKCTTGRKGYFFSSLSALGLSEKKGRTVKQTQKDHLALWSAFFGYWISSRLTAIAAWHAAGQLNAWRPCKNLKKGIGLWDHAIVKTFWLQEIENRHKEAKLKTSIGLYNFKLREIRVGFRVGFIQQ